MLREYEADHHTGMDIGAVAEEIYAYTSGYPVLVSAVCKCLSEELPREEGQKDAALWSKRSGEQFIVELKLWRGNEYNERGQRQLIDYLEFYDKDKGYMLGFNVDALRLIW